MQINQVNQTNNRSAVNFNGAAKFMANRKNLDAFSKFAKNNGLGDISLAFEQKFVNVMFHKNEAKALTELENQGIKEYIYFNKPDLTTPEFDTFTQATVPRINEKIEITNIKALLEMFKKQ